MVAIETTVTEGARVPAAIRQGAELTEAGPNEYLLVGIAVALGAVLAALLVLAADFSAVDRPDAVRTLLSTWLAGVVAVLGVASFDRFYRAIRLVQDGTVRIVPQTNFQHVLLVLVALVVAAGVALDAELE